MTYMLMAGYGGVLETRGTGTETQIAICRRAFPCDQCSHGGTGQRDCLGFGVDLMELRNHQKELERKCPERKLERFGSTSDWSSMLPPLKRRNSCKKYNLLRDM